ncbi:hypothetical protein [Cellulomonas sp. ATA003]|uniref:hypothetical protein n=1 Tax=Cellulomonas sp. ATA003 TaxID=3073064 RepID=UPI002873456E|nr:hypothetical protein [Cellulomonas sp. ATA003]WNB86308.1 hypothetical protein REH70_03385 [Cellulomonas sp. ATA003]
MPTTALATAVPLAAFSRAAYTEPLTIALAFGGLTMAWSAFETRSGWRLLLAGALVGSPALVRIDGAASVIGFVVGLALVAAAPLRARSRSRLQVWLLGATLSALLMVGLGYLDLWWHSPGYLNDLGNQFTLLVAALIGSIVVGLGLVVPPWWDPARRWLLVHRRTAGRVLAAAVPLIAVVLVSRPLWLVGHRTPLGTNYSQLVGGLQAREGLEVDPTRSYDEMSVAWIAWYHGWPMVVLAFAGLSLMAYCAVRRRDSRLLVLLAVIAAPTLLYLWRVSISPDQVWAVRRLLPIAIPGFLLAATIALASLWSSRRGWVRAGSLALAAVVAAFPLTTWGSLFTVVEQGGRWGQLEAVCAALPHDRVVYVRDGGPDYLPSLRSVCDVEVVEVAQAPTTRHLADLSGAWDDRPLSVVTFSDSALPWPAGAAPQPVLSSTITGWAYALSHLPTDGTRSDSQVWVAEVTPDGTLNPVGPSGRPGASAATTG